MGFMALCGSIYNAVRISHSMSILSDEVAIERISRNLGIPPDWQALRGYIKEMLPKGIPRNQALKELEKIGPYIIEPDSSGICETVEFQLGLAKRTRYRMWLCYENDEFISLRDYIIISE
jgi:hypothetical protein